MMLSMASASRLSTSSPRTAWLLRELAPGCMNAPPPTTLFTYPCQPPFPSTLNSVHPSGLQGTRCFMPTELRLLFLDPVGRSLTLMLPPSLLFLGRQMTRASRWPPYHL